MSAATEEQLKSLVLELMAVAGGDAELARGEAIVDPQIVMHMDGFTARGRGRWRGFMRYLRHHRRRLGLRLACDDANVAGDRVTVHAHVHGGRSGQERPVVATFRIADGRVVELWTRRANYTAVLGDTFATRWGFLVFLVRVTWWLRTHDDE